MRDLVAIPSDTAIRTELTKILSSAFFASSPRMNRFLKYVVETALEGKGALIKEYVIALEVFDKSDAYDPREDSTVRTEASKLRARLSRYYENEGQEDPVIISVPKGGYVPAFQGRRDEIAAVSSTARRPGQNRLIAAALAAAIAGAGIFWFSRSQPTPQPRLVPLTSLPGVEKQPSLSPDGSRVAFSWKGDIYVKQVGAEKLLQITKDRAMDSWPAWSPDASQIAFVRNDHVLLVSPLGGGERIVAESVRRVAWMPDGSALLVLQKTSALGTSVFRVTLASGEKQRLTFPSDTNPGDVDMSISPDGRKLAFCRVLQTIGCELFVMPAAGGEVHQLTNDHAQVFGMAWTADSREVVFSSTRQNAYRLWRIPALPANRRGVFDSPKPVEAAGDGAGYPSISRNGRLAYQHDTRNWDIVRAEIAAGERGSDDRLGSPTPVINSTRIETAPAWSPDGKKIAFVSNRSGYWELWICDADGSNPVPLSALDGPSFMSVMSPHWSSDNERLIFSALTGPNGRPEGYIVSAKGGTPKRIDTTDHRSMAFPIFSLDGGSIYFIPGPQERAEVWRMPSAGGPAIQITRGGGFTPQESLDGKWLCYSRYETHGVWCAPTAGGAERQILNSVLQGSWTIGPGGIYYFEVSKEPDAPKVVKFYNFETCQSTRIGTVAPTVLENNSGTTTSVSHDGRWLLYTDSVNREADLMLVDHFR
jgi:Tol biopolymer transport system component